MVQYRLDATLVLKDGSQVVRAGRALCALAVRRTKPLLLDSGVPQAMSDSPEALRDAARGYLRGRFTPRGPFGDELGYSMAHTAALRRVFEWLGDVYGEQPAVELAGWIRREFVDWRQANLWQSWAQLLPRMAAPHDTGYSVRPTEVPEWLVAAFLAIVRTRFNEEMEAETRKHIESAYRIPLSPSEVDLTRIEAPDSEGNYPSYDNVITTLEVRIKPERAYRTWQDIVNEMAPADRDEIIAWASAEASRSGIPWSTEMSPDTKVADANEGEDLKESQSPGPAGSMS